MAAAGTAIVARAANATTIEPSASSMHDQAAGPKGPAVFFWQGAMGIFFRTAGVAGVVMLMSLTGARVAQAEVRFGKNVRVGGHDFSGQRFGPKRRGIVYLYNRQPANAGCRWERDRDGGRTRICHLKTRPR